MISGFFTRKKGLVFASAFIIGVVIAAPARTSDPLSRPIAKDGSYKVGSCNVVVNHFENEPSKVGIGLIQYSQTEDSAQSYVEYDTRTREGSCVYFMTDRYPAKVTVEEAGDFKTVTLKCGGLLSSEDGRTQLVIDSRSGKVLAASQDFKYARYAGEHFSFPLVKDAAPSLNCRAADHTQVADTN